MTMQQRLVKQRSEDRKRMHLQSRFLRKTGERVTKPEVEEKPRNPFRNEVKVFTLKKEKMEEKQEEISRSKAEAAAKAEEKIGRAKKFKKGLRANGQPRLGSKIQDILEILQKETK